MAAAANNYALIVSNYTNMQSSDCRNARLARKRGPALSVKYIAINPKCASA